VPIAENEKEERFNNAPKRRSNQRRYNNSAVSKFSDQQIDSSQLNPDFVEKNDTVI
jgi:hypothetical protein